MPGRPVTFISGQTLMIIVAVVGLWLAVFGYLRHEWTQGRDRYLDARTRTQDVAWRAVLQQHQTGMRAYFDAHVMRPEVLELLTEAQSVPERAAESRMRLYRRLYPLYDVLLTSRDVQQFHFHTPDGRSFLRFHSPHRSGDSLWDERYSIRTANKELRPVVGFEAGKVVSGFRNVFPILDKGRHLGSVEISQPFEALRRVMAELDPHREFAFLVSRPLVYDLLFEEYKTLYAASPIHPDWFEEDPYRELPHAPPPLSVTALDLTRRLRTVPGVAEALDNGVSRSFELVSPDGRFVATLTAIPDIEGRNAAFLLAFAPAPELAGMQRHFQVNLAAATALLLVLGAAFLHLLRLRRDAVREKDRLRAITRTMGEGLYVSDPDGRITLINPAAAALLGHPEDILLQANGHDLFHRHGETSPPDQPAGECPILRTVLSQATFRGQEIFLRQNGAFMDVDVTASPMIQNGEVVGAVTIFRDVTEDRKVRRDLEASRQDLRAILESLPSGVLLIDAETHIILQANPSACAMIGVPCAEVEGRVCHDYICPAQIGECPITDLGQTVDRSERVLRTVDGRELPILKTVTRLEIDQRPCLLESFVDISEQVLARRVAEEADRQKSEFLANMSHEIRTPLNGVQGMLQMMRTTTLSAKQRDYLDMAERSARRLTSLLTDILTLSRIEAGKFVEEQVPFTVDSVFRNISETFDDIAQARGLGLVFHADRQVPRLRGDAMGLEQILFNLVGNGLRFTLKGAVLVTAEVLGGQGVAMAPDPATVRILFTVQDTGPGIPDELLERVFEPFTQADGSYTRPHEGAGLGLTVVQRLVRRMGGTMAVDSEPGRGTTIHFALRFSVES